MDDVPNQIVFQTDDPDPEWRGRVQEEFARYHEDPNCIPIICRGLCVPADMVFPVEHVCSTCEHWEFSHGGPVPERRYGFCHWRAVPTSDGGSCRQWSDRRDFQRLREAIPDTFAPGVLKGGEDA